MMLRRHRRYRLPVSVSMARRPNAYSIRRRVWVKCAPALDGKANRVADERALAGKPGGIPPYCSHNNNAVHNLSRESGAMNRVWHE